MSEKLCNRCGIVRDHAYRTVRGRRYLRTNCRRCESQKRVKHQQQHSITPARRAADRRRSAKLRQMRAAGLEPDRWVFMDSKSSARKRELKHTLTREQVAELISQGCSYCGDGEGKMTLDRIDNSLGYTTANVVPACVRCNLTRGAMPHVAWLQLVPGMRRARKRGLFGAWVPGNKRREVEDAASPTTQRRR